MRPIGGHGTVEIGGALSEIFFAYTCCTRSLYSRVGGLELNLIEEIDWFSSILTTTHDEQKLKISTMEEGPSINPDLVLKFQFSESIYEYTERDVALYALGVGAPGPNPVDPLELPFVYHPKGQEFVRVLPTFPVVWPFSLTESLKSVDGLHYDPKLLLHGEQYLEIYKQLPTRGRIRSSSRISGLHDKVKAAIVEVEVLSHDDGTGELLCLNRFTVFLRGAGGFSPTSSKLFSYSERTTNLDRVTPIPPTIKASTSSPPTAVFEDQSQTSQALLYRLSGDYNPIHADPAIAGQAGFDRPILMGLCSLGYAVRAVIRCLCFGDSGRVQSVQGRFLSHVFPGEKLVTEMWADASGNKVTYICKANGRSVLSGFVTLTPPPASRL
ncbi:hypothetical protein R1sor_024345 [Riccia sorocarpa]|uniref:MaoC-like domain-containing protein n=1 Tax=Riccia sorocarpa TaxID=122646 RepID=A0ABD3GSN9_9MARC